MKAISETLMHCTVRLECITYSQQSSVGTSFLFLFSGEDENEEYPVLVTNKHVIEDANIGKFVLTQCDNNDEPIYGNSMPFSVEEDFCKCWIEHPDPNIDLCVMPIGGFLNSAIRSNIRLSIKGFSENEIIREFDTLNAFEEVFMIGYPNALWDESNNQPIIRKGITATNPKLNYNGKKEFLIDAACFPGSSGSPVFQYITGMKADNNGNVSIFSGAYIKLLGVLYAGPMFDVDGDIKVKNIPTSVVPFSHSQIPMNLGMVIKIDNLLDMKDHVIRFCKQ